MRLPFNENDATYMTQLDCLDAASEGRCFMSYANTARHVYHRYGFKVMNNAELKLQNGSTTPHLKATRSILKNAEILWAYGNDLNLPTTYEEEKFSRINGNTQPNQWPFSFSRTEVIDSMTKFPTVLPEKYTSATKLIQENIEAWNVGKKEDVLKRHEHIDLRVDCIARCRTVDQNRKDDKNKKIRKYDPVIKPILTCNFFI
jgi:hypothetical protein